MRSLKNDETTKLLPNHLTPCDVTENLRVRVSFHSDDAIVALEDDPHDMNAKLQMMTDRQSSFIDSFVI